MKSIVPYLTVLYVIMSATVVHGQTAAPAAPPDATAAPPPSAPAKRSPAELEKLAMPIALHPDPLIAVLLPASVYPVEIVQAARFVQDTNNISKVDEQPWDDNVKAVAKFPQLIAQLDKDLNWTVELGQAFLDQPKDLMDTIQALRAKAQTAGTLQTSPQQIVTVTNMVVEKIVEQQTVVVTNTVVQIQPASTEVVYVPSYPPTVYYPPPGYVYSPLAPLVTFGAGMVWGAAIAGAWNNCNWGHGDVEINNINVNKSGNINTSRNNNIGNNRSNTRNGAGGQKWQPDQSRMRTSGAPNSANRQARGWDSGNGAGSRSGSAGSNLGARPSTTSANARPSAGNSSFSRPSSSGASSFDRPSSSGASSFSRPSSTGGGAGAGAQSRGSSIGGGAGSSGSAFSGVGNGGSARTQSNRGASSLGGGGRSGGGFSGGGGRGGGGRGGGGRR